MTIGGQQFLAPDGTSLPLKGDSIDDSWGYPFLFECPASQALTVDLWAALAKRYADEPMWIEAFWELLEAYAIGWCFWTHERLDTDRSVVSVERTPEWNEIVAFAEHPRSTFKEVRESRPRREVIDRALGGFLDRVSFGACRANPGYLAALGLRPT